MPDSRRHRVTAVAGHATSECATGIGTSKSAVRREVPRALLPAPQPGLPAPLLVLPDVPQLPRPTLLASQLTLLAALCPAPESPSVHLLP